MTEQYLIDTCIWRDHYQNRFGQGGRPLGEIASKFFMKAMKQKWKLLFSDLSVYELKLAYGEQEIEEMFGILSMMKLLKRVEISQEEHDESKKLAVENNVSKSDSLHAVLARNNNATVLTQNQKDFEKLEHIAPWTKPDFLV